MTERRQQALALATVLLALVAIWYVAAVLMNYDQAASLAGDGASPYAIARDALALDRPKLPAPDQVATELFDGVFDHPVSSPRSLLYHAGVTALSAAVGLALALAAGIAIAIGIVHVRTLDRALMPWIIASQTVPVLAIAPMVVVVLGNAGFTGLLPKALIVAWLSFLPITASMVKGLRAPDPLQRDLMRTYNATAIQVLGKLRWPASLGFFFPGLKVAAALALVGAIVAELPTGAQAGLGARLLAGSYYGQTLQIWAALLMSAFLALLAVGLVELARSLVVARRGGVL
jgi:NitT/TauT family transport system permease protein